MKKYIRKHLKDEKRILKLMYKKGIFEILGVKLQNIGWQELMQGRRLRRRKNKRKYGGNDWLSEMHIFTVDYWGEGDSHSAVDAFKDHLIHTTAKEFCDFGFPINLKYPTNARVISELQKMPTIKNDSKFNAMLNRSYD